MRVIKNEQGQLGEIAIADIKLDIKSRDDIPQILKGLQYIYTTPTVYTEVFKVLEEITPEGVDKNNGRPGMNMWKILVLGSLRVNLNWDYDRLVEMANNHTIIRQMLGTGWSEDLKEYKLQTVKDNVSLLTPEILDKVNQIVVKAGQEIFTKKEEKLKGKCDSFVVETDVHFPTDINLLFDAIRKVIMLTAVLFATYGLTILRQSTHNIANIKQLFNKIRRMKRSKSKNKKKKQKRDDLIKQAYESYIDLVTTYLERVENTLATLPKTDAVTLLRIIEIEDYIKHARRQIDQIKRRIFEGETIPHDEKVFSLFEEHTEWICKGKAGVPVELGLKVCILEDQHGFILYHKVIEKQTDDQIAVSMVEEAQERFPLLAVCSFDRGFHSPSNQTELKEILESVILPKKGKLSKKRKEVEHSDEFLELRRKHSAVESGINAIEVHGLDRCLDHGLHGFRRYVALAVVGRNLQKLGAMLIAKERKAERRRRKAA